MKLNVVYYDVGAESVRTKTVEGETTLECLQKAYTNLTEDETQMTQADLIDIFAQMDYDSGVIVHAIVVGEPLFVS